MLTLGFALTAIIASVHANDWNTPCTDGACGYIWTADSKTASSSMMLAGSTQVLSDITPAAGWQIMGCDPNWSSGSHDIRMMCAGTAAQTALCDHLYANGGAENTVVRLPQNCGKGPFARVQKTYVPQDQSVPANLTKVARRAAANSTQPAVRGLTLDYDFKQVPESRGKLLLGVASSNVGNKPLTRRDLMNLRARGRGRSIAQRGFFEDLGNGVKGAFDDVKSAAGDVVNDVKSVAGDVTSVAGKVVDKATSVVAQDFGKATSAIASVATAAATAVANGVQAVKDATSVNKTDTSDNIPISVDDSFPLIDASIACQDGKVGGSASLHIDVATKVNANVKFGYTFVGSVVPLKIDDAKVFSTMSGDASATFNIAAQAAGKFNTGLLPLFKSGLPGLSIPGIVALGPEFSLNTQLNMDLDVEAQMSVTTDFAFPNVELAFPQSSGASTGKASANKGDNPLKISSQQAIAVTGTITPHIIPRVDLGIDIGDGLAKATVFLDMDISGDLVMQVQASGTSSKTIGGAAAAKNATDSAAANATDVKAASAGKNDTAAAKAPPAKAAPAKDAKAKRADVGGCVSLTGKIAIEGGIDGALEPIFDKAIKFPIFSTQAELFKKCFGDAATPAAAPAARAVAVRSISGGSTVARVYRRAAAKAAAPAKSLSTKNEVTPAKSTASTSQLSCGAAIVPLGALTALI